LAFWTIEGNIAGQQKRDTVAIGSSTTMTAPAGVRPRATDGRSSLAVICVTRGPGPRVAALLDTLRPAANEIVVALDDRADPDVRADLAAVADRILLYPYLDPVDRPLPWLFEQCRMDWVLSIDDDEIPSLALIEALPTLCAARDVTHYSLPRRWLFPDLGTYLDDAPWRPDYQLRLVRTDARFIRFSDEFHRPIAAAGPGRFLELPLWHVDTIIRSHEQRLEKARRYEQTRPGMRVGARALNFAFYVPEARVDAPLAAVPAGDRALIETVLSGRMPGGSERAEVMRATREEIDAYWPSSAPAAQAGTLELLERPAQLIAGEQRTIDVRVRNSGEAGWPWGWDCTPEVRLGSRWFTDDGVEITATQMRSALAAPLGPGQSDVVPVHVLAPERPGRYRVEIDLIHEHVRWFGVGISYSLLVEPRRRIAVMGGAEAVAEVAKLLEAAPELDPVVVRAFGPSGRDGYAEEWGVREYLLGATPANRGAFILTVAARTLRLAAVVGAMRLGRKPSLPRGGGEFLTALGRSRLLVFADLDSPPWARELWRVAVSVYAARALNVPVAVHTDSLDATGRESRVLTALIMAAAIVTFSDVSELLPLVTRN
jgi:hypothetical protein